MTFAISRPTGVPRSIPSEVETTVLSWSMHHPKSLFSLIELRLMRSSFQAQITSNWSARLLSQSPRPGVSNGSTEPDTSESSAQPMS